MVFKNIILNCFVLQIGEEVLLCTAIYDVDELVFVISYHMHFILF